MVNISSLKLFKQEGKGTHLSFIIKIGTSEDKIEFELNNKAAPINNGDFHLV